MNDCALNWPALVAQGHATADKEPCFVACPSLLNQKMDIVRNAAIVLLNSEKVFQFHMLDKVRTAYDKLYSLVHRFARCEIRSPRSSWVFLDNSKWLKCEWITKMSSIWLVQFVRASAKDL